MDCPPKKVAVVERWPLLIGGRQYRFDCSLLSLERSLNIYT